MQTQKSSLNYEMLLLEFLESGFGNIFMIFRKEISIYWDEQSVQYIRSFLILI